MTTHRPILFLGLLACSGLIAYQLSSKSGSKPAKPALEPVSSERAKPTPRPRALLLDGPRLQQMDPTNYEVTVTNIALEETGNKIEREALTRLQELTIRYQLTANQRREAFPLLVSHHPDYNGGLIVNGFTSRDPEPSGLASELSLILDLNQQELFQEDLVADTAWWRDVLSQIRDDIDRSLPTGITDDDPERPEDDETTERPDSEPLFGD